MSCSSFWIWQRDDAVYNEHSKLTNCTPYIYVALALQSWSLRRSWDKWRYPLRSRDRSLLTVYATQMSTFRARSMKTDHFRIMWDAGRRHGREVRFLAQ